jgi:hypothetical protein
MKVDAEKIAAAREISGLQEELSKLTEQRRQLQTIESSSTFPGVPFSIAVSIIGFFTLFGSRDLGLVFLGIAAVAALYSFAQWREDVEDKNEAVKSLMKLGAQCEKLEKEIKEKENNYGGSPYE